ncbi:MAG: hypothetical protein ACLRY6_22460 [[Clostridium] innocuum]
MYYYEVESQSVVLNGKDAYVASERVLREFDLLVIDSKEHGFITVFISRQLTNFEAISLPFEIGTYLMKMDIEGYLRKKKAEVKRGYHPEESRGQSQRNTESREAEEV